MPVQSSVRLGTWAAALGCICALASCGHARDYIWIEDVPQGVNATEPAYRIAPGDVIGIKVWGQEANSIERTRVRDDGRISVPILNDVEVAGVEPADLGRRLEVRLKPFIVNPIVTVVLHERRPLRVSVVGRVTRPGVYDLDEGAGVVQALAAAGGMTPFAHEDRLFVLRNGYRADRSASPVRIRFRYEDLRRAKVPAATFHLRRGDVVVVE